MFIRLLVCKKFQIVYDYIHYNIVLPKYKIAIANIKYTLLLNFLYQILCAPLICYNTTVLTEL